MEEIPTGPDHDNKELVIGTMRTSASSGKLVRNPKPVAYLQIVAQFAT